MIHILICILAISTIPASLFLFDIPNFITILSCMFITVSFIFCLKSGKQKRGGIIALSTISVLSIALTLLGNFEVDSWQLQMMKNDLVSLEGLQYLGFSPKNGIAYTFENADRKQETITYYTEDFIPYEEYIKTSDNGQDTDSDSFVSYEIDEERSLAILTLDSCTYNDEYRSCLKQLFTEVKDKHIQQVAVDLRSNGGGNSLVANEFIRYLDADQYNTTSDKWRLGCFQVSSGNHVMENKKQEDLLFHGNVYVLTSPNTFSSAMIFAQYITDNNLGTIIGEAPGNTPNGYGEVAGFKLPNSQMYMQISTKEFFRADQNNPERLVEPDIPCSSDKAMDVLYENLSL